MQDKNNSRRRAAILAAAVGAAIAGTDSRPAEATTYTYTPAGTTDAWSVGTNWSATPASAADTRLTFVADNASVIPNGQVSTSNNDIAGNFQLNVLDLQGTGPATTFAGVTLGGNALEFVSNGPTTPTVNLNALNGTVGLGYTVANNLLLTNNTTVAGDGTATFTLSGGIGGAGSLTKTGTSTLLVIGANTYSGGTVVSGGTLRAGTTGSLPGYNASGQVVVNSGGTLSVVAANAGPWGVVEIDALLANATFTAGSALGIHVNDLLEYGLNITGAQGLTKSGGGTLVLGGTNTYAGNTRVSGGVLQTSLAASLPGYDAAGRVNATGGTLRFMAGGFGEWTGAQVDTAINNATFGAGSALQLDVDAGDTLAVSANISHPGALTKTGGGTLALSGTNTYTGTTALSGGTVIITNGNQIGTGNLNLGNALNVATLQVDGGPVAIANPIINMDGNSTGPVNLTGSGSATFSGTLRCTEANGVMNVSSNGLTTFAGPVHTTDNNASRNLRFAGNSNILISGVVSNGTAGATTGQLTYQGTGTLTLTGTNTHAGRTNVTSGTIEFNNQDAFGTSNVWLGTATTNGTIVALGSSAMNLPNGITVDASNSNNTGGILVASAPLTFNGPLSSDDTNGRLEVNNSALTTFAGPVNISTNTSNRTLRIQGSGDVLLSGVVANGNGSTSSSLRYQGAGTLTMTGTNTYSGTTTVTSGTMVVTDVAIPANNAVTSNAATYRMSGTNDVFKLASLTVENAGAAEVTPGNNTLQTNLLTIGTTSRLNLADNDLIVNYTGASVEGQVRQWVKDGRLPASTHGILSTPGNPDDDVVLAVADNVAWGKSSFNGINIDTDTVVGKYTYFGDANLDGKVTGDDYVSVDANLGTGDSWLEGDFNMNGVTTGDDYVAIDANLGKGTPNPLAFAELKEEMVAAHVAMFGEEYLVLLAQAETDGFGASVVPEPGAMGLLGMAAALGLRRVRRRQ